MYFISNQTWWRLNLELTSFKMETATPQITSFHRTPQTLRRKHRTPWGLRTPQHRKLRFYSPHYHMKKCPTPQIPNAPPPKITVSAFWVMLHFEVYRTKVIHKVRVSLIEYWVSQVFDKTHQTRDRISSQTQTVSDTENPIQVCRVNKIRTLSILSPNTVSSAWNNVFTQKVFLQD